MKWKTTFTVYIDTKDGFHSIKGILKRLSLTKLEVEQGKNYWEAEINSFRRAILSEEIIAEENYYLADKEGKDRQKTIKQGFLVFGIFLVYLSTIFPFIIIVNYLFKFPNDDISLPYLGFALVLLHIYYFKYRYLIVLFYHIPEIISLILYRLKIQLIVELDISGFIIAGTFFILILHRRLFIQDMALSMLNDYETVFLLRTNQIGAITEQGFVCIKDYLLQKRFYKIEYYDFNKISYKDLFAFREDTDFVKSDKCVDEKMQLFYSKELIAWNTIKEVKLHIKPKELVLYFHTGKVLELPYTYENWFVLVQQIPETVATFHKQVVTAMFENFILCPICGVHSFDKEEDTCYCCNCWSEEAKCDYPSEEEAIFDNQHSFLLAHVDNNKVNMNPEIRTNSGFNYDTTWKPIVSENDVLEFLKSYE